MSAVIVVTVAVKYDDKKKINNDLDHHITSELEGIGYTRTFTASGPDVPREIFFKKQFIPESRP